RAAQRTVRSRKRQLRRLPGRGGVRDSDDVGDVAAVLEVPIHGQREHAALLEAAVQLLELHPASHEARLGAFWVSRIVLRCRLGKADERGDSRGGSRKDLL